MSANTVWSRLLSFFPEVVKGNSGAAPAVDWTAGSVQSITLNAATVTPTFTAPPSGANLALVVTQDGTGGRAVTWPAAVKWIGGTAPILLSGAAQTTLVYFYFDGTTFWGSLQTGASPSSIIPWTAVAAGTALAASLAKPNLAADSSGAQSTITLPTAAAMAASDGFEFTIKATGAMVSPVIVTAGAGSTLELLNAPGTFGASTWMPIQGQGVVFKYDLATTTWKARANTEGNGSPGSSAYNPNWYAQTDVYWDPQAGVDSASGVVVGAPVLTFAEIVRRFGAILPQLTVSLTVHKLSAQNAGQDEVFFLPRVSEGRKAVLVDTLVVKSAAFVGGAVTARNQATGQLLAVAGFPGGTAAGDYVFNQTRNSYANVVAGGATPTFTTPVPAAVITTPGIPTLSEDNTWTTGDTFIVYTRPLLNLKAWRPLGQDLSGAGNSTACCGWVQWSQIPDTSAAGTSVYLHHNESAVNVLSGCQVLSRLHAGAIGGRGFSTYLLGCDTAQAVLSFSTNFMMWGTSNRAGGVSCVGGTINVDGGSVLSAGFNLNTALCSWGDAFVANNVILLGGSVLRIGSAQGGATPAFWGTGPVLVEAMASMQLTAGTWAASLLTSGTLNLGALTTGVVPPNSGTFTLNGVTQVDVAGTFPVNATIKWSLNTVGGTPGTQSPYFSAAQAANAFHVKSPTAGANDVYNWTASDGTVAITAANLDTYGALVHPNNGGRFCKQAA